MKFEQSSGPPASEVPSAAFSDEEARARILGSYKVDALQDDEELSAITDFAARLCDSSMAFVSVVERDAQRFIARAGSDLRGTPRGQSFCAHTMVAGKEMVVTDASRDPRFADNELVTGEANVRFYAGAPLVSPEGAPIGALCVIDDQARPDGLGDMQIQGLQVLAKAVMRRLDARRKGLAAVARESDAARTMREIADLLPAIIWSADGDGKFDYFNSRWSEVTGAPRPDTIQGWAPVIHPDDVDQTRAAWSKSAEAGKSFELEYRLKHADGSWRWNLARAIAVLDEDEKVRRWYGTLTDIDERHRQSEGQDLLARELSHRIKNIFAVVAGLVSIRARKHEPAREFAEELVSTIRALGRAHDFVRPVEGAKGDSLRGLLTELMAPYADDDGRIRMTGDDCAIGPRAATPLALIFHELATNSAKYGALSVEGGSVEIAIDYPEEPGVSCIRWRESGGPGAADTGEEGFGTRLVKMSIEGQLGGRMERRFAPGGMEVDLEIPLKTMRS